MAPATLRRGGRDVAGAEGWATGRGRALLELAPGPNGGGGGVVGGGGLDLPDNTTTVSHLVLEDPIIAPC